MLRSLLTSPADDRFNEIWKETQMLRYIRSVGWGDLFKEAMEKTGGGKMGRYFADKEKGIGPESSNEEVATWVNKEVELMFVKACEVMRKRLEEYEFPGFDFYVNEKSSRIYLQLPLYEDPKSVRKLLRQRGDLWFQNVLMFEDCEQTVRAIDDHARELNPVDPGKLFPEETELTTEEQMSNFKLEHPFYGLFSSAFGNPLDPAHLAMADVEDTTQINELIVAAAEKGLTKDRRLRWMSKMEERNPEKDEIKLICLEETSAGRTHFKATAITKATTKSEKGGDWALQLTFDKETEKEWLAFVRNDPEGTIATVMDKYVLAMRSVKYGIKGKNMTVSRNFTKEEAKVLAAIVRGGKYPTEIRILGESWYNESGLAYDPYASMREPWDQTPMDIFVIGEAISLESGAAIRAVDGTIYFPEGIKEWENQFVGSQVVVSGIELEKRALSSNPKGNVVLVKEAKHLEVRNIKHN